MKKKVNAEKAFNKFQLLFMTKVLWKVQTKGNSLNVMRNIYKILLLTVYSIVIDWIFSPLFPLQTMQECMLSPLLFNTVVEILVSPRNSRKLNNKSERGQWGKLSFLANVTIIYIKKIPKDQQQKLLALISDFSKVKWYKIKVQKSVVVLLIMNTKKKKGK